MKEVFSLHPYHLKAYDFQGERIWFRCLKEHTGPDGKKVLLEAHPTAKGGYFFDSWYESDNAYLLEIPAAPAQEGQEAMEV